MQSLRPVEPFPFTAFRHGYGSSSDPLRFSLHRSETSCAYSPQAAYPSPPMPGSSSLNSCFKDRFSSCQGEKRKHSELTAISTKPPGAVLQAKSKIQTKMSGASLSLSTTTEQPQLLPALSTSTPIPPRTIPLPPRSTRRAKAHVASACVNCKRKHLGCDSARPCRRCVVAGKEVRLLTCRKFSILVELLTILTSLLASM